MATAAVPGMVLVRGRFGSIQVAEDLQDIEIAVPLGATHVEIHQLANQQFYYSWTGFADEWMTLAQRPTQDSPFKMQVEGAKIFLRKAYNPRYSRPWPGIPDAFMGDFDAGAGVPPLVDGVGKDREFYRVSVAGAYDFGSGPIVLVAGDFISYNGATGTWAKAVEDPRKALADDRILNLMVTFTKD